MRNCCSRSSSLLGPLALLLLLVGGCGSRVGATSGSDAGEAVSDTVQIPETNYYAIDTPLGRMVVRLSDDTPLHRDNFKRLVAQSFYDSTTFHRVIYGFMIQGGDPNSRDDDPDNDGQGGPGYTIPAEFRGNLYHRKGALATARTGDHVNPQRESSGSQFYIVHGTRYDDATLDAVQEQIRSATSNPNFAFTEEMREVYRTQGGAPNLDQQYTVFGQLVEGFDVLDAIASTNTARSTGASAPPHLGDRPLQAVPMVVTPLEGYSEPAPGQ